MQNLERKKVSAIRNPSIKLLLEQTDVPEDAFPTDKVVLLPTYAKAKVVDEKLLIDLIIRDVVEEEHYGLRPDFRTSIGIIDKLFN